MQRQVLVGEASQREYRWSKGQSLVTRRKAFVAKGWGVMGSSKWNTRMLSATKLPGVGKSVLSESSRMSYMMGCCPRCDCSRQ